MKKNFKAQLDAIIRESNDLYEIAMEDGVLTDQELVEILDNLDRAANLLEQREHKKNPQQMCHLAYTRAITFDRELSDEDLWLQAKEDGFDPDFVLFLSKEL